MLVLVAVADVGCSFLEYLPLVTDSTPVSASVETAPSPLCSV